MWKKVISRAIISMSISALIAQIIMLLVTWIGGKADFVPLVPDFADRFQSPYVAMQLSILLTAFIGGVFGAASMIYEIEKWSFLKQGIIHFIVTSAVWIPISMYLWGLFKYPSTLISVVISFTITYGIMWFLQYRKCCETIRQINERLIQLDQSEEE